METFLTIHFNFITPPNHTISSHLFIQHTIQSLVLQSSPCQKLMGGRGYISAQDSLFKKKKTYGFLHFKRHQKITNRIRIYKAVLSSLRQFLATKSSLKIMKNTFYFILKALPFSRYLNFDLNFWSCRKKARLERLRLILKSMMPQPMSIRILTNISRSKGDHSMKFHQLIGYNMINIFFEKSYTKCGDTIPRPFPKTS